MELNIKEGQMNEESLTSDNTKCTEEIKDGHPKHFIILIRHGERSDDPERELRSDIDSTEPEVKFDCHLTDKGMKQAVKTGEFIKESVIGQNRLKIKSCDIKVFSSPFLRCVQTASGICQGLGFKIPEITLDDRLGEFMMKSWFQSVERPLAHLTLNHVKNSTFQRKYLGGEGKYKLTRYYGKDATPNDGDVNVEDEAINIMESNTEIKYPETYSDMYYRYSGFINNIIYQEFFENPDEISSKSKVTILVSHGFAFDPFIN
jgi:broad specificity phosphatase PhoE